MRAWIATITIGRSETHVSGTSGYLDIGTVIAEALGVATLTIEGVQCSITPEGDHLPVALLVGFRIGGPLMTAQITVSEVR